MTRQHLCAGLLALLLLFSLGCGAAQPTATAPSPTAASAATAQVEDPYPAAEEPPFTPPPADAYPEPGSDSQEPAAYDIKGNIADVQAGEGDRLGQIRVEGEKIEGNRVDRAAVTITQDTIIREQKDGQLVGAGFEDLEFGALVEVTFTGPVAESYPVQATAGQVIILNRMPKN